MNRKRDKIYVGLSGGVDSAVSAALLKKKGYEVTGIFIKAWVPPGYSCSWKEDRRSAMRAAAILDIPFMTFDLEEEYKKNVIDYMIAEYKTGRTPNPDVMCNKEIKFGAFLKWALEHGANYVATGHYARIKGDLCAEGQQGSPLMLLEGTDKNKDQSYFLWTLTQEQLRHVLFPVGHLKKEEVRRTARKFGLPQAERKDSQGLCFLGQIDMKEFLSRYIDQRRGDVLNERGEVIGYHNGAWFLTIGERHSFTVTKKTSGDKPLYVISKDIVKNTITVSCREDCREDAHLGSYRHIILDSVNWISSQSPKNKNVHCRLRYRQKKIECEVKKEGGKVKILLKEDSYISPGQSLVFYNAEVCLGGGIMR